MWLNGDYKHADGVKPYVNNIVELLNPKLNEFILDAGSGPGEISALIKSKGANVVAVDNDHAAIKTCHDKGIKSICHDITKLHEIPKLEKGFDAVICNMVFNWLNKDEHDVKNALKSFSYVLKENSRVVINTGFALTDMDDIIQTVMAKYHFDFAEVQKRNPIRLMNEEEVKQLMEESGFKNVNISIKTRKNELPNGIEELMQTFRLNYYFDGIKDEKMKECMLKDMVSELKETAFYDKGSDKWFQVVPNMEIVGYKGLGRELHQTPKAIAAHAIG